MSNKIEINNQDILIFLVDNHSDEIKYLKEFLDGHNYKVEVIPGGEEGVALAREQHPQVIICDVQTPELSGYDFCALIKEDPLQKETSVILLTQVTGPSDITWGLECGADNFILRPYNNKQVLTRLYDILSSKILRKGVSGENEQVVSFQGRNYRFSSNNTQVLDLLFSVLENALQKNNTLEYVNNQLMGALDNIRNLDQLKDDLISSVSHEIRTPLTSINGALRLIKGGVAGEVSPKAMNMVDIASRNADRLMLLLNDILDIQKIESGQMEFNFTHARILPLVLQAVELNTAMAEKYNIKIQCDPDEPDCVVNVDPDRLIQVLTNLLSNATKFSPSGEIVKVRITLKKLVVRVSVIDHGPGIPEKYRATIYDKFTQTNLTATEQKEGTGLGLNIAKSIIERLHGIIDFKSGKDGGTTFFIELPRVST